MPPLALALQAILEAELAAGNIVQEVSAWPPKCELLVVLRHPFGQAYVLERGVAYRLVDDPHYWQAEYVVNGGQQVLACGFE